MWWTRGQRRIREEEAHHSIMKALVFHHPGKVSVDNVPDPSLQKPDDVIVRVTATAICGSDLHIYNGFLPQKRDMVLGHEFVTLHSGQSWCTRCGAKANR